MNDTSGDNHVTNLDYLSLLAKGNTQFVKEMISTFLLENPKEIHTLEQAVRSKDFERIRQTAHLLQSSVPFVGLDTIILDDLYEMEKMASSTKDIERIESLFLKVKNVCEMAWEELKAQAK